MFQFQKGFSPLILTLLRLQNAKFLHMMKPHMHGRMATVCSTPMLHTNTPKLRDLETGWRGLRRAPGTKSPIDPIGFLNFFVKVIVGRQGNGRHSDVTKPCQFLLSIRASEFDTWGMTKLERD